MSSKHKPPEGYATWIDFAADQLRISSEYAALQNELADLRRAKELIPFLIQRCDALLDLCMMIQLGKKPGEEIGERIESTRLKLVEARQYLEQEQRDAT